MCLSSARTGRQTTKISRTLWQWEAGQFVEEAQPSRQHHKNIDDAALRRLANGRWHPALRRLTTLDLDGTPITDAAPLAALVGLTKLDLNNTQVAQSDATVAALRARGVEVII